MERFVLRVMAAIVMMVAGASMTCSALDFSRGYWWALNEKNVFLKLKEYGAYDFQTGTCLNRFVPSYENNNPYESLQVITDGEGTRLLWSDSGDGSWSYRVRIVDDTIYLTGRRRISGGAWQPWDSWIRIVDWNGSLLFTVSKEGTYRVYEALAR